MGLVAWILLGLLAGLLARLLVPGRQRLGCIATTLVGIAGALVGGFVAEALFDEEIDLGFDLRSLALATVFAALFLLLLEAAGRRRG